MSGRASGKLSDRASRDLTAAVLVTTSSALPVFLVATMEVQIRDSLHFGSAALGLAISLFYLGAATISVPASRVAESVGGARVMRVLGMGTAGALLLLGTEANSWTSLAVFLGVAGCFSGAMAPATNLFLARRSPEGHQGFAFGIKQSAVPFASLLGGLAVPAIALSVGWQWAFRLGAVMALLAAASVPASRLPFAERRRQYRAQPRLQVRTFPLVVVGIGFGLGVLAASGCTAFLVSGAVAIGYSKGMAGILAAVAGVAALVGRVLAGLRADQRGGRHFRAVVMMLTAGAVGFGVAALGAGTGEGVLFGVAAVAALGSGWGWNGLLTYAVVRSHPDAPAAATGVTQVGARLGGVVGPTLVGVVVAGGSYADAWLLVAGAMLCAAAAVLVGYRLIRVSSATPPSSITAGGP